MLFSQIKKKKVDSLVWIKDKLTDTEERSVFQDQRAGFHSGLDRTVSYSDNNTALK